MSLCILITMLVCRAGDARHCTAGLLGCVIMEAGILPSRITVP